MISSRPAISVENLGKSYRISHKGLAPTSLREAVARAAAGAARRVTRREAPDTPEEETFWALRDVSFDVRPGEIVGVLGRNGAGKSTLLKILSRITEPTEGVARVRGRLASLLEVGTGFHFDLTGRENIYLNGSILGMKKAEIDAKFDQIVAFSEVERFLDTQVKHYSTGMFVRLAFAVAAHLETQILFIDEVLSVGDIGFQNKCLGRIEEVTRDGRTVLFVSHNVPALQSLCTRCILMERGRLKLDGNPADVLNAYNQSIAGAMTAEEDLTDHPGRTGDSRPSMKRVRVVGRGAGGHFIRMGDDLAIEVEFECDEPISDVFCRAFVKNSLSVPVVGFDTDVCPPRVAPTGKVTAGRATCRVDAPPLMPGTYTVDLFFGSHRLAFDTVHEACRFEVHPADVFGSGRLPASSSGSVYWPGAWEIRTPESAPVAANGAASR